MGWGIHLDTLLAARLRSTSDAANPAIKGKSACIQAAFLVGWALDGAFFGRLGGCSGGAARSR